MVKKSKLTAEELADLRQLLDKHRSKEGTK
jgi:hypothetical protein